MTVDGDKIYYTSGLKSVDADKGGVIKVHGSDDKFANLSFMFDEVINVKPKEEDTTSSSSQTTFTY
jgi:hypothetical protein